MSFEYLPVAEDENEEPIELPIEEDGTLMLTTVSAQFPGCCGLKYRHPETKTFRGIRLRDGRLYPPPEGWGNYLYICSFPKENKRKSGESSETSSIKSKRNDNLCSDLIVLGLPWKATEQTVREYFEKFGEVLMAQLKRDPKTGMSKGFAFIRFSSYTSQMRVLAQRHMIDGRWCDVRIPNSKEGSVTSMPCKVFVGRCTEDLTANDLREYFSQFGEVTDVFIPKPFRAFSFITFLDPEVAQSLCGQDHIIKGVSVNVSNASPKQNKSGSNQRNLPSRNYDEGHPHNASNNNSWSSRNMDMVNMQALGLSGQHGQTPVAGGGGQAQGGSMPLGMGGLPVNQALVAAALNQAAGWGLINNIPSGGSEQGAFAGPASSAPPAPPNFLSWMQQGNSAQGPSSQWGQRHQSQGHSV
ncbi:unnamed protein product [Euphydryas editha]|uniref:TAR DNA-binding protein 43 n=1 Tax=Euphydryas editha TaxID=104508 RepID=A0AAU9TL39_EUPED|nr:unnamed protein product [Euphydryas editha]